MENAHYRLSFARTLALSAQSTLVGAPSVDDWSELPERIVDLYRWSPSIELERTCSAPYVGFDVTPSI